jgi:acyl-CoA thioester hydrolase
MTPSQTDSSTLEIRVRYAECDPMGYLHHAKFLEYFEMGRTELLRASGFTYRDMEERGKFLVVAKLEVRYQAAARYDEVLTLHTKLRRITRARIEHEYVLSRAEVVLCQGSSTLACVDRRGQLQAIPDEIYDIAHAS